MSRNALRLTSSLEQATNLLLTDPDSCMNPKEEVSNDKQSTGHSSSIVHKIPGRVDDLFKSPDKVN
jgi:hypothetical protein